MGGNSSSQINKQFNIAVVNNYDETVFAKVSQDKAVVDSTLSATHAESLPVGAGFQRVAYSASISLFFDLSSTTGSLYVTVRTESGKSLADSLPVKATASTLTVTEDGSVQCSKTLNTSRLGAPADVNGHKILAR